MSLQAVGGAPAGSKRAAKKSANTKRILDAAIKCLNVRGYANTTLALIAEMAGVSRGQVQNIFGVKRSDLLIRIAEEIFNRYADVYDEAISRAKSPVELVDNMWDAIRRLYKEPETLALIEVWLSTRNDKAFNRQLKLMITGRDEPLHVKWVEAFSKAGLDVDKVQVIRFLQRGVMRGLAIEKLIDGSEEVFDEVIKQARATTRRMVTGEA